jgi:hypothetical protein
LAGTSVEGATSKDLWSVTVEPAIGWYAIISQDCDIVRDVGDEPCLQVCPLGYVTEERWSDLRHGPYSPREFPYPDEEMAPLPAGKKLVLDARFVTSVDKTTLLHPSVQALRPLTAPQKERLAAWIGRRFARHAHADEINDNVLRPAAAVLLGYLRAARRARDEAEDPAASGKFMLAAEEWFVGGTGKWVVLCMVTSRASIEQAGVARASELDVGELLEPGRSFVEKELRAKLPAGKGYGLALEVWSLGAMPASKYRDLAVWAFETEVDPLGTGPS